MGILNRFRRKKDNQILLQEVQTLMTNTIRGHDRNRDGIPDYIQRPDIPSLVRSNKDLTQWEMDVSPEIEIFIMLLRGYEFDPETATYKPVSPPTLNEIGIRKIKTHLLTVVNKHAINTSLKLDEVHEICQYHTSTLIKWFKYNSKKCGVSYSDLTPIIAEFDNMMFLVLSRAIDDGQRKHVSDRTRITANINPQAPANFPA